MFVVAGVTGKVGGVVARRLLDQKKGLKVIVHDAAKASSWSLRGAEVAVGSVDNAEFLSGALKGASGFFTLLPPNFTANDVYAYQRKTADAIVQAVQKSGVRHVVMLSSTGADLDAGTGPIKGLHYLEQGLRGTSTILTALRSGMFQENVLSAYEPVKKMGMYPSFMPSVDLATPSIATKDIGAIAADQLIAAPAKSEVIDLQGPSYSVRQIAQIYGALFGKSVKIMEVPEAGRVEALQKGGLSKSLSEAMAEMYGAFATGKIKPVGDRAMQGTTPLEETLRNAVAANEANLGGWFEIPARDLGKSQAFYEAVLGMQLMPNAMGPLKMAMFPMNMAAAGSPGALVQGEGFEPSNRGTMVYLSVADIERTLAKVQEKGGKVLSPKRSIGDWGFVGEFQDPDGNRVALHSR
jgi:predicted enzyme related to lactoylglutathione lyase/uncharacterized protein YbjT (DUF2867 family)